jgi:KDO2-lipid IV(A) lauroyltransferase
MVFKNPEVIDRYFDEGRSVVLAGGHYNNWELFAVAIDANIKHRSIAIYKPLSNVFFDDKMRKTRGKYGLELVAIKEVKNTFETNRSQLTATIFGTDQSPGNPRNCYWTTFLNQDTGVLFGTEKYAREYNYPVIYGRIRKVKRGFYEFDFVDLFEFPTQTQMGEITEAHTRQLEQDIMEKPEFWLWSHRRWKHKKPTTVS